MIWNNKKFEADCKLVMWNMINSIEIYPTIRDQEKKRGQDGILEMAIIISDSKHSGNQAVGSCSTKPEETGR